MGIRRRFKEWRELRTWRRELRGQARLAIQPLGLRWWREPLRWCEERRRRRLFIRTGVKLEQLRRRALSAADDETVAAVIDEVNAILERLEVCGALTTDERVEFGRSWLKAWVRDAIAGRYRQGDALGVAAMTLFLKTG